MKSKLITRNLISGLASVAICLTLLGCGDAFSGSTYKNINGVTSQIEFKSGQKAYVLIGQTTYAVTYSVDDDKITLDSLGEYGKVVLTIQKDGTLTGMPPVNTTLKKTS